MEEAPSMIYFTCTLGEASQSRKSSSEFETVNKLIRLQAERRPNLPAVAFPVLSKSSTSHQYEAFTFRDLYAGSLEAAVCFCENDGLKTGTTDTECVALLCHSSIDFLFAWLGLIRAGYSVLLIAPQCNPAAIISLCKSCKVTRLYHDKAHLDLASSSVAEAGSQNLQAFSLPWENSDLLQSIRSKSARNPNSSWPEHSSQDVAYIHHSSGTSSGIPKPIPQTHHGAVGVLPCLEGQDAATFTTTPLYHGGIADCFRAWTSNALIWLFPGADAPITSDTILSCLSISEATAKKAGTAPVKYFSSVPYILQMLSETPEGLKALQEMDIVGVGGAALPESVGTRLVTENVNLVSRFGSAECGFLLSSHRTYSKDQDWQYLRVQADSLLNFEHADDESGLSELIVLPNWPHMAKRNRDDGSYATCDLFELHATIKNAWKYHSRSDSQITLLTGKKFDPAPLEEDIKSSSSLIDDIFIFGNDRQMPGALVIPSQSTDASPEGLKQDIWKLIQEFNLKQQPHARIAQNMFHVLNGDSPPLERSSKGTLLRGQAEKLYASIIDGMYQSKDPMREDLLGKSLSGGDLESTVRNIVFEVMGKDLNFADNSDFFQHGVDSTKATQIRSLLQQNISHDTLPWNIVYDCENIKGLIRYFASAQNQEVTCGGNNAHQNMIDLAAKYSNFEFSKETEDATIKKRASSDYRTVILTGATGGLGAHILNGLRDDSSVSKIICLVRATDEANARDRVSQSLTLRRLHPLSPQDDKIAYHPTQFGHANLGLPVEVTSMLRETVTHIIHAAWAVNFSLSLGSFINEHISGLQSLLQLAASYPNIEQFVFCSSTASVIGQASQSADSSIPEAIYRTPPPDSSLGYSKSKWVAEAICSKAGETSLLSGKVKILRVGQLTGDTTNGVWNRSEAWPLMLSAAGELGCLPKLEESLSWLPVDVAARAVIDISLPRQHENMEGGEPYMMYHLVNNDQSSSWKDLLRWINNLGDQNIVFVEPNEWLGKLESLDQHPAQSLLGLWQGSFGTSTDREDTKTPVIFDTRNAMSASSCMRNVESVDEKLIGKIWSSLQEGTESC